MSIVGATSTEGLSSLQRFTNIFTAILTSFRHKRAALANSSPLGREDQHQILAFGFLRAIVLKVLKQKVSSRRCRSRSRRKQQRRRRDCTFRTGVGGGDLLGHLECVLSDCTCAAISGRGGTPRHGEGRPRVKSCLVYIGLSMRLCNLFGNRDRCYFCFLGL